MVFLYLFYLYDTEGSYGKIKQTLVYHILATKQCLRYGMSYGGQWSASLNYAFTI